jgi:gamma-glutamyltranspeptidase/glutathione hydrolase
VLLNNRAAQFSSQPGHPNALAAGHRPRHSILPAMVLRDGLPEFVMGVIGGNAHPQGLTQILVNALDLGMNPQHGGRRGSSARRGGPGLLRGLGC